MSDAGNFAIPELSWSPPIPSVGRGGQRATVPLEAPFDARIKSFFLQVESSPDFFVRTIPAKFRRQNSLYGSSFPGKIYLQDLHWTLQYKFIISRLYGRYSLFFQNKLSATLKSGKLRNVRQWFFTANGVVFPYLLMGCESYDVVDRLTRYALEGCASNYPHFMSSLKKTKKLMRKYAAIHNITTDGIKVPFTGPLRQHSYYVSLFNSFVKGIVSKRERFRTLLLWTQSRATGLCDSSMIEASLSKFRDTVVVPSEPLSIDVGILQSCIRCTNVTGAEAQVSTGPKACLQSPQQPDLAPEECYLPGSSHSEVGGQTRYLLYLCTHKVLRGTYNLHDLVVTPCEPRPVRSSVDLLNWAIQEALESGPKVRAVRYHCVEDQSKARSITVAHYAYQVIMGVFAHTLVPAVYSAETKAGLSKDRNLWRFLHEQMAPEMPSWEGFKSFPVKGFSTDLSEATDFGNWWFARAVWSEMLRQTRGRNQPTALMLLAKTLYTSPRAVFFRVGSNKYDYFITRKGFLMGDLFTKIVLTIGQDYNVRLALMTSPLGNYGHNTKIERTGAIRPYNLDTLSRAGFLTRDPVRPIILGASYSLVGDDIILLYIVLFAGFAMEGYFRRSAESGGWKISDDDTFDSKHLLFYCEEGSLVPQNPLEGTRQRIHRGRAVDYLDYPRLRLLLPVKVETNTYSHTNVGRFSLLGKETLWTVGTASQECTDLMFRASILQHLVVPRDIETLCPFTPQEIGGDGSYSPDPEFFSQVIRTKAKDVAETLYRMKCQLTSTWSNKFVASDKPRGGVMKQHLILPTMDRMKKWIPERSIIEPPSAEHAELLSALPRGILESPQVTFFKLVKRVYNSFLFKGFLLPNLMVRADVESKRGSTSEQELWQVFSPENIESYLEIWRRPGFSYRNKEPYFVVPHRHKDIMSVGWNWKFRPERPTENARIDVHSFLDTILHGKDIPLVVDRLNMFFESDPLILIRVRERPEIQGQIVLVSKDKKLAHAICKWVRFNRNRNTVVHLVDPIFFFLGRIEEFKSSCPPLFDAGSISFLGRSISSTNIQLVACRPPIRTAETNYPGVYSYSLDGFIPPSRRRERITTEGPSVGEIQDIIVSGSNAVPQYMEWLFSGGAAQDPNGEDLIPFAPLVPNQEFGNIRPPSGGR